MGKTLNAIPPVPLLGLSVASIRRAFAKAPANVWATLVYVFFEYVRPQAIYPWLNVLPFSRLSLIAAIVLTAGAGAQRRRITSADVALLVFSAVMVASSMFARYPFLSYEKIDIYFSWVVVFWIISTSINTRERYLLLVITWLLWNFKMTQHAFRSWADAGFGFRSWGVVGPQGWFHNSGEFGVQMCVVFPVSLYFALAVRPYVGKWLFRALLILPVTAVSGALASSSRGAVLGVLAVALFMLAQSKRKLRSIALLVFAVGLGYLALPEEQKLRFSTAGEDKTSTSRLLYWERGLQLAAENPMLGIGYANWMPVYFDRWGWELEEFQQVEVAHNTLIECVSELGYLGLLAFAGVVAANFQVNAGTRSYARRVLDGSGPSWIALSLGLDGALVGFLAGGFFVSILYYPYLWINLAMSVALQMSMRNTIRTQANAVRSPMAVPS